MRRKLRTPAASPDAASTTAWKHGSLDGTSNCRCAWKPARSPVEQPVAAGRAQEPRVGAVAVRSVMRRVAVADDVEPFEHDARASDRAPRPGRGPEG